MISMPKYSKIEYSVPEVAGSFIKSDKWHLQEKIDGSMFRFMITKDGEKSMGTRNTVFDNTVSVKGWESAIDTANHVIDKCYLGSVRAVVFYTEYLASTKHNTIKYDRVPLNNLYLFDIINLDDAGVWRYYKPNIVVDFAYTYGLEPVETVELSHKPSIDEIKEFINKPSILGGPREGTVIKHYDGGCYMNYGHPTIPMFKFVKDDFKELNKINWKQNNPNSGKDLVDIASSMINKEAVWKKAVFHARDKGLLVDSMRDMMVLVRSVEEEFAEEYDEVLRKEMYDKIRPKIVHFTMAGFAEWYKKMLYENMDVK